MKTTYYESHGQQVNKYSGRIGGVFTACLCMVGLLLATLPAQAGASAAHHGRAPSGTVTMAYPPTDIPNYIFPMIAPASDTPADIFSFIEQFWLPLYYFATGSGSAFNERLSLAYPPKWSPTGKTATIRLKSYKWSDGKPVTTRDVEFWINLLKAEPTKYANWIKGTFPTNVTSFHYVSPTTMTITFNKAYNKNWLLYNQLSVIFVAPQQAWDKTSANGKIGTFDLTRAGAKAVWTFLNSQSLHLTTYQSNPLWQVVDGPFRLKSYTPGTQVTIVPNREYSGSVKPKVAAVQFLNFTSDTAEYRDVLSGKIDYGYVPFADMPSVARVKALGYSVEAWPQGGMNYAVYNYSNPTVGPLFKQLYIRQAIQSIVDQQAMIKGPLYGYGVPTYGPVPKFAGELKFNGLPEGDSFEHANPYPYSISHAKALLSAHGWKVKPEGVDTCERPGKGSNECGAGITKGEKLSFSFLYASGVTQYKVETAAIETDASSAGIQILLRQTSDDQVVAEAVPCTSGSSCPWEMAYWYLSGWQYGMPINYPLGTIIFGCGGEYAGGYCSPTLTTIMSAAKVGSTIKSLYRYENYLTKDLPVMWLPLQPYQMSAISNKLHGVNPQNNQFTITPQYWSLGK